MVRTVWLLIRIFRIVFIFRLGRAARDNPERGGGIYLWENGGKTGQVVLDQDRHIYDVTIDPTDPNVLYAAGFESSAWRSPDRGLHWNRIPGFNFKWGHRVIPDPTDA